jgi:hypothetical protein
MVWNIDFYVHGLFFSRGAFCVGDILQSTLGMASQKKIDEGLELIKCAEKR